MIYSGILKSGCVSGAFAKNVRPGFVTLLTTSLSVTIIIKQKSLFVLMATLLLMSKIMERC